MVLYHFTGTGMLRPISRHGLTVGDVPTDIRRSRGLIGVWLTDSDQPDGHGLNGSAVDKKRCRISVDVDGDDTKLAKWSDWAPINVTEETIRALSNAEGGASHSWFVYFGWLKPERLFNVFDMQEGMPIENWKKAFPVADDRRGVPYWHRAKWHKALIKQVDKAIATDPGGREHRPDRRR